MDRSFSLEAHEACPGCEKHALSKGLFLAELQEMKKEMAELKETIEVMERTSTAVSVRMLSHLEGIRSHLVDWSSPSRPRRKWAISTTKSGRLHRTTSRLLRKWWDPKDWRKI
ncbi:uncharacterized protein [Drosophila kikkawai]|uniref:Uncharacterized protein n=1 Tax=Drosophila kikkawai TaxID=30033 RepID=A0ABM3C5A9_DROKI|nr:uncharacterized protein LOC108074672 [Drosophila kikkawai]